MGVGRDSRNGMNGDGFPEIEREPVPMPELPDHPTPLELARAYTTVVLGWYRQWPRVVDALHWLYGATMAAKAEAEAARKAIEGGPKIDPDSSYNTLSVEFNRAAAAAYAVAKDPSNPLTMADMVAVARGVVKQAKHDSDASRLKRIETGREKWRERGWQLFVAVILVIVAAVLGHYGWK